MKRMLIVILSLLAVQIALAVFTGANAAEIPIFPGFSKEGALLVPAWFGVFIFPGLTVLYFINGLVDLRLSRPKSPSRYDRFYPPTVYMALFFTIAWQIQATLNAMEVVSTNMYHFSLLAGVFVLLAGNVYPRVPFKSYGGWPLPWLFKSEKIWRKTHRFTGFSWAAGGVLIILLTFLDMGMMGQGTQGQLLGNGSLLVLFLGIVPVPYSYFIYRKSLAVQQ